MNFERCLELRVVTVIVSPPNPSRRIVLIYDLHLLSRKASNAYLGGLSEEEQEAIYEDHIQEVEQVQARQRLALEALISKHGLKAIYIEGLTENNREQFAQQLAMLKKVRLPKHPSSAVQEFVAYQYRLDLLAIGAACRLAMEAKLEVLPAEDSTAYEAANPLMNGKYDIDLAV